MKKNLVFQMKYVILNAKLSSELVTDCLVGKRFNEQGLGRGEINCLQADVLLLLTM